jgi:hypothetical protein
MVSICMRTPKTLDRNPFPPDGNWHLVLGWQQHATNICRPEVQHAAEQALLKVFTPDWCLSRGPDEHPCHPFEWWWAFGAGFRQILELGYALHLLGSPPELADDLLNDRDHLKFHTRSAEAWAGCFMRAYGAEVNYISAGTAKRSCEARLVWPDSVAALEVKSLQYSAFRKGMTRLQIQLIEGLHMAMFRAGDPVPSWPDFELPVDEMMKAAEVLSSDNRDEPEWQRAHQWGFDIGLDIGNEWMGLLHPDMKPGHIVASERVIAEIRERDGNAASFELQGIGDPPRILWDALRRQLRCATGQVEAASLPGILVADSPWIGWPSDLIQQLVQCANDKHPRPWQRAFGAVLLRLPHSSGHPGAWVVPISPNWERLPKSIREAPLVPYAALRFLPFDLLGYSDT